MTTKHTPTPWIFIEGSVRIGSATSGCVADLAGTVADPAMRAANGRFIVLAVNNHDKLVAALKTIRDWNPENDAGETTEALVTRLEKARDAANDSFSGTLLLSDEDARSLLCFARMAYENARAALKGVE